MICTGLVEMMWRLFLMVFQTTRVSVTIQGNVKVQLLNFVLFSFSVLEIPSALNLVCKLGFETYFRSACNLHLLTKTSWICLFSFRGPLVCNYFHSNALCDLSDFSLIRHRPRSSVCFLTLCFLLAENVFQRIFPIILLT